MKIHLIAAARPNFMKVAPLWHEISRRNSLLDPVLVHTGQHYDPEMSDNFLRDFRLPKPDFSLGVGSGSHAQQTARVLEKYEDLCSVEKPSLVVVVGDVNSTFACALAAKKLNLPVAHLEAGLRSGDRSMPEEINRLATDSISDWFWTPSPDADENLLREGVPRSKIAQVGNIMIDSFLMLRQQILKRDLAEILRKDETSFAVVTIHRPSNVDSEESLLELTKQLVRLSALVPLVFPVHPRTRSRLIASGYWELLNKSPRIHLLPPQGYIDFMALVTRSQLVITDSGGVQEETTYLGIPCITLRTNTERPITVTQGTNRLIKLENLLAETQKALAGGWHESSVPLLWDGVTAMRVVDEIEKLVDENLIS
jgi:UDP-N-acetylglucosamine 2-epimerase (non-hydrolysing)